MFISFIGNKKYKDYNFAYNITPDDIYPFPDSPDDYGRFRVINHFAFNLFFLGFLKSYYIDQALI